jgi:hypothetical protein
MPDHSSSRTTEHWFLDLDGVRSGPYQTPEILSLIAEGEVMPHHRISTGLKNQQWMSIIDWRFEQAKKVSVHEPEVKEVKSYIPASARPPEPPAEPKVELADEEAEPVTEEPAAEEPATPEPTPPAAEKIYTSPFHGSDLKLEPVKHSPPRPVTPEIQHTPPYQEEITPEPEIPVQTFEAPKSTKRDPMAEMFDVLQTSKQKREAKSQQIAQQQNAHISSEPAASSTPGSGLSKTLGIGVLITVIGFALGQIFQQSAPPPSDSKVTTPTASAPVTKTEVVDRSTDKMTIRGKVEVPVQKPAPAPSKPSAALNARSAAAPAASPHTEKELQELKDLKKELQELKALKEELKNSGGNNVGNPSDEMPENIDEFDNGNISNSEVDQGYNYYPAGPNTNGGAAYPNNGYPNPNYMHNGQQPSPNQNVHY